MFNILLLSAKHVPRSVMLFNVKQTFTALN